MQTNLLVEFLQTEVLPVAQARQYLPSTRCTPFSALDLSRALRTRAGTIAGQPCRNSKA